jgi:multicomponent Na+:H+ antiporter subunit G
MLEALRFYLCAVLMLAGLMMEISAVAGVNRFRFVLNRIHAAGMGDTLGILLMLVGLCVKSPDLWLSLKLLLIILFFWLAGPVSTHLIGRLEYTTNEQLSREVTQWKS